MSLLNPPAGQQQQQQNPPADWRSALPEDIRADPSFKDIADVGSLGKSFINAQKLIGVDKIAKPSDKWTPEQWKDFYKQIGAPDKPEAYELPKDLKLAEGLELNNDQLNAWRKEFMESGLTKGQADRILKRYFENANAEFTGFANQRTQAQQQAETVLKQEFGDQYDANLDIARGALKKFGSEDLVKKLVSTGLGNDPAMVKVLLALGKATMDDQAIGGGNDMLIKGSTAAQSEINRLKTDKEFQNALQSREVPGHKEAVARWLDLHQKASTGNQSGG